MSESSIEISLLVVIIDVNPGQLLLKDHPEVFTQYVEAVIAFCNSHLMLKSTNKLAVLACNNRITKFLLDPSDSQSLSAMRQQDGQYELFTQVEKTLKKNLVDMLLDEGHLEADLCRPSTETHLAGALAMALCFIHRLEREKSSGTRMNSRILVVTGTKDCASQYMNYMNIFFTAQKLNVTIDICSLSSDLGLLQQGCDISGGIYLRVPQLQGLLQYLMWVFLPEPGLRQKLVLPPPVKVDYRAACFCHRELVDIGFVCSVCLSIFCKFSPICTTCHTVFKNPGPLPVKSKKKRMKLT